MKKYVKPELYYESFELSQHIAGCNLTLSMQDEYLCTAEGSVDGDYITGGFLDKPRCSIILEGYCYTNGSANVVAINS